MKFFLLVAVVTAQTTVTGDVSAARCIKGTVRLLRSVSVPPLDVFVEVARLKRDGVDLCDTSTELRVLSYSATQRLLEIGCATLEYEEGFCGYECPVNPLNWEHPDAFEGWQCLGPDWTNFSSIPDDHYAANVAPDATGGTCVHRASFEFDATFDRQAPAGSSVLQDALSFTSACEEFGIGSSGSGSYVTGCGPTPSFPYRTLCSDTCHVVDPKQFFDPRLSVHCGGDSLQMWTRNDVLRWLRLAKTPWCLAAVQNADEAAISRVCAPRCFPPEDVSPSGTSAVTDDFDAFVEVRKRACATDGVTVLTLAGGRVHWGCTRAQQPSRSVDCGNSCPHVPDNWVVPISDAGCQGNWVAGLDVGLRAPTPRQLFNVCVANWLVPSWAVTSIDTERLDLGSYLYGLISKSGCEYVATRVDSRRGATLTLAYGCISDPGDYIERGSCGDETCPRSAFFQGMDDVSCGEGAGATVFTKKGMEQRFPFELTEVCRSALASGISEDISRACVTRTSTTTQPTTTTSTTTTATTSTTTTHITTTAADPTTKEEVFSIFFPTTRPAPTELPANTTFRTAVVASSISMIVVLFIAGCVFLFLGRRHNPTRRPSIEKSPNIPLTPNSHPIDRLDKQRPYMQYTAPKTTQKDGEQFLRPPTHEGTRAPAPSPRRTRPPRPPRVAGRNPLPAPALDPISVQPFSPRLQPHTPRVLPYTPRVRPYTPHVRPSPPPRGRPPPEIRAARPGFPRRPRPAPYDPFKSRSLEEGR
ncbi:MAG: hypothetical protein KVP17_004321 [Porospora cf. gigantea B]|uniref:uncharacterized protein n=1 Tax=Porospora cf. gigantea B TaxID=2853592 RepID=UPI003571B1D4|nr:MAG: hypothetical protein KVP17_004321 [Porospora cf. gigantea B]